MNQGTLAIAVPATMHVSGLVYNNKSEGGEKTSNSSFIKKSIYGLHDFPSHKDTAIGVVATHKGNESIKRLLEKQASQQEA